ncbi:MAG: tRNA (N(6)-L-threonylcarbamoyladenosine(37)-C(2))-methylthiotransferase MtaB [Schwartzia sp.]|nr:tRNA (N(6)-L-threonylcarbamoyladenosine(37)-C(2))-methylthiotransferase MtaB [Schwartzia sp. (in: firmicutes)]
MTLGCKVNQFETETMEGLFRRAGYDLVPFGEAADVCVVNTCSVTALGEKKSRQIVRRAKRLNDRAIIAVTGCYAQLSPKELAALDGVRLVVGTKDRARIVELVEQAAHEDGVLFDVGDIMQTDDFEDIPLYEAPARTRAFLKIQEGCENFCTFCIIPYARGPLRSRPLASVRREAEKLVRAGFKEIVLTGIHLGAYGRDLAEKPTLADAAREILSFSDLARLRLSSLESVELSDELFALLRDEPRFAKHLHLPLQAGSDAILRAMNRHYDTAAFARLLENVRDAVPDVSITTDVIVGFPGETDALFEESLAFVSKMGFAKVHVFPYSRREGTPAARMAGQLPMAVKKERVRRMEETAEATAKTLRESLVGKTEDVLFETETNGVSDGLTGRYMRVYTNAPVKLGEIVPMRLSRLYQDGFWAETCE